MTVTKDGRVTKAKRRRQAVGNATRRVSAAAKSLPLVERTNELPIEEFIKHYMFPVTTGAQSQIEEQEPGKTTTHLLAQKKLDMYSAANISRADLEACLDLVELTSREAYAASSAGWSRPKKRKEMKLPDMKYLIVRKSEQARISNASQGKGDLTESSKPSLPQLEKSPDVLGFLSFMVTYEDGKEVIYCYEIHLSPSARGQGLGALLMSRMEEIGRLIGLEKAMLTVFKSNATARRFYEKGGYEVDEYSPQPRRLRNGTIKEADYLILSKRLKD